MCGIFGIISKNTINTAFIKKMLIATKIRGKHATGISFIKNNNLVTKIIDKSAEHLSLDDVQTNAIIGHCRYSTSSLAYNQPIFSQKVSIVHNGVITQKDPSEWDSSYKFYTENDSEFILKSWENNKHPINDYPQSSIASIILEKNGIMNFFRNEKRPLYYFQNKKMFLISSTQDILRRVGLTDTRKTDACYNYKIEKNQLYIKKIKQYKKDLQ